VSDTDAGTATEAGPEDEAAARAAPTTLHGAALTSSRGEEVAHPSRETYRDLARTLRDEGFEMCVDVTAVDYLVRPARDLPEGVTPERFEVVANLLSMAQRRRVRLRVQVPEADPSVASLFAVYPGVEAMEREVFDMFGIRFDDHPDLTRILMPEDWEGHPLRKDYPIGRVPVQFKHPPATR
jgi:NADH-quinone oxidoreductase subunit C